MSKVSITVELTGPLAQALSNFINNITLADIELATHSEGEAAAVLNALDDISEQLDEAGFVAAPGQWGW